MNMEFTATVILLFFESNQKYFYDLVVLEGVCVWGGGGGVR